MEVLTSSSGSADELSVGEMTVSAPEIIYYTVLPDGRCIESHKADEIAASTSNDDCGVISSAEKRRKFEEDADTIADLLNQSIVALGSPSLPCCEVATLVFFDLETTGLPHIMGASNVQITEISMIAVSRKDFINSNSPDLKDVRVVNKLTLCVRPRSNVSSVAANITGLNDLNLQEQKTFNECTAHMVCNFLMHLPEPACLLAHNGDVFDFPLLKAELSRMKMFPPHNVFTADTLSGCRSFRIFDSAVNGKKGGKKSKKNTSHSLANLYLHFFGKRARNSHSSENDCKTLMMVCHKTKDRMIPWIDANKKNFNSVNSMW